MVSLTTLYRAANRTTIAPATFGYGPCFCERLEDAEAYLDNPGFGGRVLVAFHVDALYRVEAVGRGRTALVELARSLEFEEADETAERWLDRGFVEVFHVLENVSGVEERCRLQYDWVVYDEPGVGRARGRLSRTWRYYGNRPLVGRMIR